MSTSPSTEHYGQTSTQPKVASLDAVLRINAILRRAQRTSDSTEDEAALRSLTEMVDTRSGAVPNAVVHAALERCGAGSAAISVREGHADGDPRFRWQAVSGRLSAFLNYSTPGDFSPCQVCLERDEPVLFAFPERRFTYLRAFDVAFVETLVVPMAVDGRNAGTLWIAAHAVGRRFDVRDVDMLSRLSSIAGSAYTRLRSR